MVPYIWHHGTRMYQYVQYVPLWYSSTYHGTYVPFGTVRTMVVRYTWYVRTRGSQSTCMCALFQSESCDITLLLYVHVYVPHMYVPTWYHWYQSCTMVHVYQWYTCTRVPFGTYIRTYAHYGHSVPVAPECLYFKLFLR